MADLINIRNAVIVDGPSGKMVAFDVYLDVTSVDQYSLTHDAIATGGFKITLPYGYLGTVIEADLTLGAADLVGNQLTFQFQNDSALVDTDPSNDIDLVTTDFLGNETITPGIQNELKFATVYMSIDVNTVTEFTLDIVDVTFTLFDSAETDVNVQAQNSLNILHPDVSQSYNVQDGVLIPVTASISNNTPVATDDVAIVVNEDTTSEAISVLANDTDIDGDALSITAATATNGTVTINTDGTLSYTGNTNFNGADVITYTIDDGNGATDTATVAVTVNPVTDNLVQIKNPEAIYASQAATELNYIDTIVDANDGVLKFELYLNAADLGDFLLGASEIRGAQFQIDINNLSEVSGYSSDAGTFSVINELDALSLLVSQNENNSFLWANGSAIVDNNDASSTLEQIKVATVYVNPSIQTQEIEAIISNIVITTDIGDITINDYPQIEII